MIIDFCHGQLRKLSCNGKASDPATHHLTLLDLSPAVHPSSPHRTAPLSKHHLPTAQQPFPWLSVRVHAGLDESLCPSLGGFPVLLPCRLCSNTLAASEKKLVMI
ncbi:hypothetical protein BKA80DRAFT_275458 [Phyllosticta citrichinensis]